MSFFGGISRALSSVAASLPFGTFLSPPQVNYDIHKNRMGGRLMVKKANGLAICNSTSHVRSNRILGKQGLHFNEFEEKSEEVATDLILTLHDLLPQGTLAMDENLSDSAHLSEPTNNLETLEAESALILGPLQPAVPSFPMTISEDITRHDDETLDDLHNVYIKNSGDAVLIAESGFVIQTGELHEEDHSSHFAKEISEKVHTPNEERTSKEHINNFPPKEISKTILEHIGDTCGNLVDTSSNLAIEVYEKQPPIEEYVLRLDAKKHTDHSVLTSFPAQILDEESHIFKPVLSGFAGTEGANLFNQAQSMLCSQRYERLEQILVKMTEEVKKQVKEQLHSIYMNVIQGEAYPGTHFVETIAKINETAPSQFFGRKKHMEAELYPNVANVPLEKLQALRNEANETRETVQAFKKDCIEQMQILESHVHCALERAAIGYGSVLEENMQLHNEVKDLRDNCHRLFEENKELHNVVQNRLEGNIRVSCRIRPWSSDAKISVDFVGQNGVLVIRDPTKAGKQSRKTFVFDRLFGQLATQEEIFSDSRQLIRSVLDGYNSCIFAYGQTGSGKSYTMRGLEEFSVKELFDICYTRKNFIKYEVSVEVVELYNDKVVDLLDTSPNKKLTLHYDSEKNHFYLSDITSVPVTSVPVFKSVVELGKRHRSTGSTAQNETSSRSHCVLTLRVKGEDMATRATLHGCLHLVDLAGNERIEKSKVEGIRLKEATHINKSLSALGDVMTALAEKKQHVPYRNSTLTKLLQSSLEGQGKVLTIVHIRPEVESYGESLSTLRFSEKVSNVQLKKVSTAKEDHNVYVKNEVEKSENTPLQIIVQTSQNSSGQRQKINKIPTRMSAATQLQTTIPQRKHASPALTRYSVQQKNESSWEIPCNNLPKIKTSRRLF